MQPAQQHFHWLSGTKGLRRQPQSDTQHHTPAQMTGDGPGVAETPVFGRSTLNTMESERTTTASNIVRRFIITHLLKVCELPFKVAVKDKCKEYLQDDGVLANDVCEQNHPLSRLYQE